MAFKTCPKKNVQKAHLKTHLEVVLLVSFLKHPNFKSKSHYFYQTVQPKKPIKSQKKQ